jgi:hypothetical protein
MFIAGMDTNVRSLAKEGALEIVVFENEQFFKIAGFNEMRPFFMSIVSDSNHWMFISSNGGLTAGRKNSEFALFPYYTDDKITEFADITGSKTIFQIKGQSGISVWEPFSERFTGKYTITRNLYKNIYGNKIIFEEINHDEGLIFRYQWNSSNLYGFVRKSELINTNPNECSIVVLDGIQNILPYGVNSDLQNASSNLVDAYKRNELIPAFGIGAFALSAIIVDKAEPSEALKANIAWSIGMETPAYLMSSLQLNAFRNGKDIISENDVKGEKGAFFISKTIILPGNESKKWKIIANVNQNQTQLINLGHTIHKSGNIEELIEADIEEGTKNLRLLNSAADGTQHSADKLQDARHYSNVLFNIMRGGIFDNNYQIEKNDFITYLHRANNLIASKHAGALSQLENTFNHAQLNDLLSENKDADFTRLCIEYLPLKFSRRHGDPSRPWNKFSINTRSELDGSKILDYEGNWRDIFQNWEALAHSYPMFIEGMIFKFLNASTFDGYNPYRVTKGGFDWETIEPDDPWSYIGYWGDHQIIYLLKFLEFAESYFPGKLNEYFTQDLFVYAAVPYIIKPYSELLQNPKDTISFDHAWDVNIREQRMKMGADGALLQVGSNKIYHVNLIEKLLATILAKMSNFIPGGGIWMNTQRPEWNDANNALVGNGVSMVTLNYLHRFLQFMQGLLHHDQVENIQVSTELLTCYEKISTCIAAAKEMVAGMDNKQRRTILDTLGKAASEYRTAIYQNGFSGEKSAITLSDLKDFLADSIHVIQDTIQQNKRQDNLYHAYNLMTLSGDEVAISHLSEMLEGQVAVLSSGYLSAQEALEVLDALKNSALFRQDQYSYLLYPNKALPGFLQKNIIDKSLAESSQLIHKLVDANNTQIVEKDIEGSYHFNGNFKNVSDLEQSLAAMHSTEYKDLVIAEKDLLVEIFEKVFNHKAFTGRSGTFYGYEGLGSIYWHMVSKLLLAAQECCLRAIEEKADTAITKSLIRHYQEIKAGIGVHKSPSLYGAFPTDPYSHTPAHRGAQQPGMTGQVKEDILARRSELGITVRNGALHFNPHLIPKNELLSTEQTIQYYDVNGDSQTIQVDQDSIFFTCFQVPVIYISSNKASILIEYNDGSIAEEYSNRLNAETSQKLFKRTGEIKQIRVSVSTIA